MKKNRLRDQMAWIIINFAIMKVATPWYRKRVIAIIGEGVRANYGEEAHTHWKENAV